MICVYILSQIGTIFSVRSKMMYFTASEYTTKQDKQEIAKTPEMHTFSFGHIYRNSPFKHVVRSKKILIYFSIQMKLPRIIFRQITRKRRFF